MNVSSPLQPLVSLWVEKIRSGIEHKWESFGKYAKECQAFYDGPHDFVFNDIEETKGKDGASRSGFAINGKGNIPKPTFGFTINKAAELEQLFGPIVYHRNPVPVIRPRGKLSFDSFALGPYAMMVDPMMQQEEMFRSASQEIKATLLQEYLTYAADELDLRTHARLAVTDALIKGRGLLWTEVFQPLPNGPKLVGAFHETVDRLVIDPDRGMRDATWIARMRVQTWWEAEDRFGYPRGYLKRYASRESFGQQAKGRLDDGYLSKKKLGMTNDLIVYWDLYSKMGIGDRLKKKGMGTTDAIPASVVDGVFDEYIGDYVYLAVCEDCPHFLNFPPEILEMAQAEEMGGTDDFVISEIQERLQWPTPYWADGAWPFVPLDPHPHTVDAWPTSHLRPALGELRFMDWVISCLFDKVIHTSREFVAVVKHAEESIKKTIEEGKSFTVIELSEMVGKNINEVVQFLQHPAMNKDIMEVFNLGSSLFDKRTGLTEIAYGTTDKQIRSASEAQIKENARNVRPGDIAEKVEHWMKHTYKQLAITARWHLTGLDVVHKFGQTGAMLWDQFIASGDVNEIVREFDYRVEAGSARKPNQERDQENMQLAMQIILPFAQQIAMATGNVGLVNQLFYDWARAQELDPSRYTIPPLVPPTMAPPAPTEEGSDPSSEPQVAA